MSCTLQNEEPLLHAHITNFVLYGGLSCGRSVRDGAENQKKSKLQKKDKENTNVRGVHRASMPASMPSAPHTPKAVTYHEPIYITRLNPVGASSINAASRLYMTV